MDQKLANVKGKWWNLIAILRMLLRNINHVFRNYVFKVAKFKNIHKTFTKSDVSAQSGASSAPSMTDFVVFYASVLFWVFHAC